VAAGVRGRLLETSMPLKLRIIDLDGGIAPDAVGESIRVDQIRSRPLQALLAGLGNEAAWSREPAPFGLRDLFSSMTRPITTLAQNPQFAGENLALVAEHYCNLSLRLGYHFNVIDSYFAADPEDNYIYFRFVGGMAEQVKRERRTALIAAILAALHFKVDRQGDLLVGKAKMFAPEHMASILSHLGELIAFTRQLDVRMVEDEAIDLFYGRFLDRIKRDWSGRR
jgi:pyruvate,water dikinase